MNYLTFVIKGNEQIAREQMFARGIVACTLNHLTHEVVFKTSPEYLDLIASWFCEVPELIPGYGYPDGTCLIYSQHEAEVQS